MNYACHPRVEIIFVRDQKMRDMKRTAFIFLCALLKLSLLIIQEQVNSKGNKHVIIIQIGIYHVCVHNKHALLIKKIVN